MTLRSDVVTLFFLGFTSAFMKGVSSNTITRLGQDSDSILVTSKVGQSLLASATRVSTIGTRRKLEAYQGMDLSWLPNYAIKVLGCHQMHDWNKEVDAEEDVRVMTKRLLRFRLCPVGSCGSSSALGCGGGFGTSSYGDYIVSMDVFLQNYIDYLQEEQATQCSKWAWNKCGCYNDGNKDDNFNQDQCEFQCWYKYERSDCYYDYTQDDDGFNFKVQNYMECGEWLPPGYQGRRLDEGEGDKYTYVDGVALKPYYIGPYCSSKGNSVFLGLFLDDTCSEFADDQGGTDVYKTLTGGNEMPYSIYKKLISGNCVSCGEQYGNEEEGEEEGEEGDDQNKAKEAPLLCTAAYQGSGKCERNLDIDYPNVAACNFIDGIALVEQNSSRKRSFMSGATMIFLSNPVTSIIVLGSLFAVAVLNALMLRRKLSKQEFEENQQAQIAFNAAQMEAHYTDLKVKDAFLAM